MSTEFQDQNPYRAPNADSTDGPWHARVGRQLRFTVAAWVIIFLLNLPFPLFCGMDVTSGIATLGMFAAIVLLLSAGVVLCVRLPGVMRTLMIGSVVTAISQFLPLLQIVAGLLAISAAKVLGLLAVATQFGNMRTVSFFGGLLITLITAGIMMLVALGSGWILQLVYRLIRKLRSNSDGTSL